MAIAKITSTFIIPCIYYFVMIYVLHSEFFYI